MKTTDRIAIWLVLTLAWCGCATSRTREAESASSATATTSTDSSEEHKREEAPTRTVIEEFAEGAGPAEAPPARVLAKRTVIDRGPVHEEWLSKAHGEGAEERQTQAESTDKRTFRPSVLGFSGIGIGIAVVVAVGWYLKRRFI